MDKLILVGRIYAIKSPNTDKVYIGSTSKTLETRLKTHYKNYNCWLKGKSSYVTSYDILKEGRAYIELIEEHEMITRKDLEKKEGIIIKQTENCVNKIINGQSIQEWRALHPEKIHECAKKSQNKMKEKTMLYGITQKPKTKKQKNMSIISHEHYEKNKDSISQRHKEYREKNKGKRFNCLCGKSCLLNDKARHEKSDFHLRWLDTQ